MSGSWSNDQPNPLEVGGGGESGSLIVYDAQGRIIATIDEDGITFFGYDGAGNAITLNPSQLPGPPVTPASIVTETRTTGFTDAADLVITGASIGSDPPAHLELAYGGGVVQSSHIDMYAEGEISLRVDNGDINLDAPRVFACGDVLTGTAVGCKSATVSAQAVTAGSDSTTSATFVNMAGTGSQANVSFNKRYDSFSTKLKLTLAGTMFVNNAGSQAELALLIDGVDYVVGRIYGTLTPNVHIPFSFFQEVDYGTVDAGTYTVQARWRLANATGALFRDVNDWLCIDVEERG